MTVLMLVFPLCFSCKSGPGEQPSSQKEENEPPFSAVVETPWEEAGDGDEDTAEEGENLPEVSLPSAEPSPVSPAVLPEPAADLPQAGMAEAPPPEEPAETSLPEPSAGPPAEVPVPAEAPAVTGTPVPALPPVAAPAEAPAAVIPAPAPPRPVPPPAPPPPVNLRPAEEEAPPAVVREPVPLPALVPEAPALPPPAEEEIVYSRIVRATVGQLVEIPFRGTGWVYLGELGSRRGVSYHSRRLDPEGQSFVFRAGAAGTYGLKFYKQDFIRDYILNDYVQVIVGDPPETAGAGWFNPPIDRGRVTAEPRWPDTAEEAEARRRQNTVPAAPQGTAAAPSGQGETVPSAARETAPQGAAVPPAAASSAGQGGITAPSAERQTAEPPPAGRPAEPGTPDTGLPPAGPSSPPQAVTDEGVIPASPPAAVARDGTAPAAVARDGTPPAAGEAPETVPVLPPDGLPAEYLRRAREEFDAGRVAAAIGILDQFRDRFPSGSDEAWWLYGQFYEANSPRRDIRTALDYYRRLMREYPQSGRYNDARRRTVYLERYYINIQ
jgi:hypothetical protein